MRRNRRLTGRSWSHLTDRVHQELLDAIASLGPLPPTLGEQREHELLAAVHGQESESQARTARRLLQEHNLKLVCEAAPRWCGFMAPPADILQEGFLGLDWAITKYNPQKINPQTGKPYRLTTYAADWIDRGMQVCAIKRGSLFMPNGVTVLQLDRHPDNAPEGGWLVDKKTNGNPAADEIVAIRIALETIDPTTAIILRRLHGPEPDSPERIAADLNVFPSEVRRRAAAGIALLRHRLTEPEP
jgi:hypothetical protein